MPFSQTMDTEEKCVLLVMAVFIQIFKDQHQMFTLIILSNFKELSFPKKEVNKGLNIFMLRTTM